MPNIKITRKERHQFTVCSKIIDMPEIWVGTFLLKFNK